jgi:hypothetical protein
MNKDLYQFTKDKDKMKGVLKQTNILIVFALGIIININAQERTNEVFPKEFISKSQKLTSAIGWQKNQKTMQWADYKNEIPRSVFPGIIGNYQNFNWIQFAKINIKGKGYYVFLFKHIDGFDKKRVYSSGQSYSYENAKKTNFFVMSKKQYKKLKTKIESKSGRNILISSEINGDISDNYESLGKEYLYTEENLILEIIERINDPYTEQCLIINSQIIDDNRVVRFLLPHGCYSSKSMNRKLNNEPPEKRMEIEYFEVKLSEFERILIE